MESGNSFERKNQIGPAEKSVLTEIDELRDMVAKHEKLADPEAFNQKWDHIEELKNHIESFVLKAAASNTVLGGTLALLLFGIGEKNPAAVVGTLALVLDAVAGFITGKVEKLADLAERQLKIDRASLPHSASLEA